MFIYCFLLSESGEKLFSVRNRGHKYTKNCCVSNKIPVGLPRLFDSWRFQKGMGKKTYFVSDSHLGVPDKASSLMREKLLVQWLDKVQSDAAAIYLLGDIFDFWFEYSTAVPKGFARLLGKIAEVSDRGIPVYFFTGNHDMWAFDYFEKELGVRVYHKPTDIEIGGKVFHIGHGDGLGPGDRGYKLLKAIFGCRLCQRMFAFLHPSLGIRLAVVLSKRSRAANEKQQDEFLDKDREWLVQYCKKYVEKRPVDYFIFGHRHLPIFTEIIPGVFYVNTGDWVNDFSYAVFDGKELKLAYFKQGYPVKEH